MSQAGTFKNYSLSGDLTKICREFPTFQRSAVPLHHISRNFSCESLCVCAHWREEIGSSCGGPVISYPPPPPPPTTGQSMSVSGGGGKGAPPHTQQSQTPRTHITHTQHSHTALTRSTHAQHLHAVLSHINHTQHSHTALTHSTHTNYIALTQH